MSILRASLISEPLGRLAFSRTAICNHTTFGQLGVPVLHCRGLGHSLSAPLVLYLSLCVHLRSRSTRLRNISRICGSQHRTCLHPRARQRTQIQYGDVPVCYSSSTHARALRRAAAYARTLNSYLLILYKLQHVVAYVDQHKRGATFGPYP